VGFKVELIPGENVSPAAEVKKVPMRDDNHGIVCPYDPSLSFVVRGNP
jgi:hypothetical protein